MMWSYKSLYKSKKGTRVIVTTLHPPKDQLKLREAGGSHIFKLVSTKKQLNEVIILAKATKTKKKQEVSDDELDELETVDDLDELDDEEDVEEDEDEDEDEDDEDEPDDEEDEDEDDEEEEPAPKKSKKSSAPRQSQAAKNGKVGTNEVATEAGVDSRTLRMVLRELRKEDDAFAPQSESGRYEWTSLKDPQVKKILKAIKAGLHAKLKNDSLQALKDKKAAEKAEKDARAKTTTKKAKKKAVVEDEEEAPVKKTRKKK